MSNIKASTHETVSSSALQNEVDTNKDYHYLTMIKNRSGVVKFLTRLEYEHFTPDTPANRQFKLWNTNFCGCEFVLVAFPSNDLPTATRVADECGLRITNAVYAFKPNNAEVTVICCPSKEQITVSPAGCWIPFIISGDRVLGVENNHAFHDKYKTVEEKNAYAVECLEYCERVWQKHKDDFDAGKFGEGDGDYGDLEAVLP